MGKTLLTILMTLFIVLLQASFLSHGASGAGPEASLSTSQVADLQDAKLRLEENLGWWPYLLAQAERSGDSAKAVEARQIEHDFERYHAYLVWMFSREVQSSGPLHRLYLDHFSVDQIIAEDLSSNPRLASFNDQDFDSMRLMESALTGEAKRANDEMKKIRARLSEWFQREMHKELRVAKKMYIDWKLSDLVELQMRTLEVLRRKLKSKEQIGFLSIEFFMRLSAALYERAWSASDSVSELKLVRKNVKDFWNVLELADQFEQFLQIGELASRSRFVWVSIRVVHRQAIRDLKTKPVAEHRHPLGPFVTTKLNRHPTSACVWLLAEEREAISQ